MIDLHCHILPGLDDGSPDLSTSLAMAQIAVADGIGIIACTPHIKAGVYNNTTTEIKRGMAHLNNAIRREGFPLDLVLGADVHISADLYSRLRAGQVPTLNNTRYFLLEPSERILPPRFEEFVFTLTAGGYVPILTHPERFAWIESRYDLIKRLTGAGVLMQLTAGSLTGRFGRRPRYWSERMLAEGRVHLLATDAHDTRRRPPLLAEARDFVAHRFGADEAKRLVETNPLQILDDMVVSRKALRPAGGASPKRRGVWGWAQRIVGR